MPHYTTQQGEEIGRLLRSGPSTWDTSDIRILKKPLEPLKKETGEPRGWWMGDGISKSPLRSDLL